MRLMCVVSVIPQSVLHSIDINTPSASSNRKRDSIIYQLEKFSCDLEFLNLLSLLKMRQSLCICPVTYNRNGHKSNRMRKIIRFNVI